jgi:hypothetical protein
MFAVAVTAACGGEPNAAEFRCRIPLPDGSCNSMPANCPVHLSHSTQPGCPMGAELIPIDEDTCAHKLICID